MDNFTEGTPWKDTLYTTPKTTQTLKTLKTSIPSPAFSFVHEIEMVARRINKSLVSNNPITLADFLPQNLNDFYRYNGSLTTPNCNEGVMWTIFKKPQNIPASQYKKLVDILDEKGDRLRSNYRDPQAVNRRTVWESCGNDNIYY
ncbi:hypothetical protein Zmor_016084 [Zophobas morio]|uniref:carbonic anhydrase n=1 Tax=Zophobas morio TaxID=2755281 RepID=A0AA38IL63_9CUCU|nr:hypothetical protein Zmor_016084 [Zophobas morio]